MPNDNLTDAESVLPAENAQAPASTPTQGATIEKRITQYIALRDKIKKEQEAFDLTLKPMKDILVKLNNDLLARLLEMGGDSVSVRGVGTAYVTTKTSASIADGDEFRRFVIGAEQWELLDWKANAPKCVEYAEANEGNLPPGVNLKSVKVVGVRQN